MKVNATDVITRLWSAAEAWHELYGSDVSGFAAEAKQILCAVLEDGGAAGEPHWLYRIYDSGDRLIYIGITRNLDARLASHQRRYGELFARYTTDEYPDRESVLTAEARAIDEEYPAFNVDHPRVLSKDES